MTTANNDVFDLRRIRRFVELMKENELSELDIQQGDIRIQLKRNTAPPQAVAMPPTDSAASVLLPVATALPTDSVAKEANIQVVRSPMVGTFYAAASPDAPPFAQVGDTVTPEKTVCLVEAMKVFNEIAAECSGKIVAVLVKNGESVEFGKPLFKVSTE